MASELDWTEVDVATLSAVAQGAYQEMKETYRQYKADKARFETLVREDYAIQTPAGLEMKFGYNFGKLSVALAPVTERKAKAAPRKSLADYLAEQGR